MEETAQRKWARQLRELLGGTTENPLCPDGCVAGYQTIRRGDTAYAVLCVKFSDSVTAEDAGKLVASIPSCMEDGAFDAVHYECTADEKGYLLVLLESNDLHYLRDSGLRALASGLTIFMDQEMGREVRIGIGSVCKSILLLPFSKADAIRNITRYNVSKTIDNIITYITINYSDPELSVGQIAKENYLNYSYMCTQFRQEVGVSPGRFIRQFRLRTAADLLTLPNRTVQEVARTVGFTDSKYFARCFHGKFGMTPNQYRRKQMELREKLMEKMENTVVNPKETEYNAEV